MPNGMDSVDFVDATRNPPTFEEFEENIGEALVSAISAAFPDRDIGESVAAIRDLSSEYDLSFSDAVLVATAIDGAPEVAGLADFAIARPCLESFGIDTYIDRPEVLRNYTSVEMNFESRVDDKQYQMLEIVADKNLDSICAHAHDNIERMVDLQSERFDAYDAYNAIADDPKASPEDVAAAEQRINELHAVQRPELDVLKADNIDIVKEGRSAAGEEGLSPFERELANVGIDMYLGNKVDSRTMGDFIDLENREDFGPFRDTGDAYAEAIDAEEKYRADPSDENLRRMAEKFNVLEAAVIRLETTPDRVEAPGEQVDIPMEAGQASGEPVTRDIGREYAEQGAAVGKQEWNLTDAADDKAAARIELPFSAREDAHVVMDYAVAKSIDSHNTDYPAFAGGMEIHSAVVNAMDYIEQAVKDDLPLSKELDGYIKELDALGPRNGDMEHDARIDELENKEYDCFLRAGAIIAGENDSPDWREQADTVLLYHGGERDVDGYEVDPRKWTPEELGEVRSDMDAATDSDDSRGGPAAEYSRLMDIRDAALKVLPDLEAKWEAVDHIHDSVEDIRGASNELFEARFEIDNAQRQLDSIAEELRICKEGVAEYGVIHTPDSVEAEPDHVETAREPEMMSREEIVQEKDNQVDSEPKTDYDIAKERYEAMREKGYGFRNVFVSFDKLKMDIAAYKEGKPGADGKMVSGGKIFMDVFEWTRGNLIESIVEVVAVTFFDKHFPAAVDVSEKDVDKQVEHDTEKSGFYTHVDTPEGVWADVSERFYDNGFVDKNSGSSTDKSTINENNPGFARYMGADMTKESIVKDIEMEVRPCGAKYEQSVTYRAENGDMETLRVPSIRMVYVPNDGRTYLVDPFGKTVSTNVTASTNDVDAKNSVEKPYFRSLDISASKFGSAAIETYAKSQGTTVEVVKERISNSVMDAYVDRTLAFIDKHEPYVSEKLIPETAGQLESVSERYEYLSSVKEYLQDRLDTQRDSMSSKDIANNEKFIGLVDNSIDKLSTLKDSLSNRLETLSNTVDICKSAKEQISIDRSNPRNVDASPRFAIATSVEKYSQGKIDNPYFGVSKLDVSSIDRVCKSVDFKGSSVDNTLERAFASKDWPKEAGATIDRYGAKVDVRPGVQTEDRVEAWKDAIKNAVPNAVEKYPAIFGKEDVGKFEIESARFDVSEIMKDFEPDSSDSVDTEPQDDVDRANDSQEDAVADERDPESTDDTNDISEDVDKEPQEALEGDESQDVAEDEEDDESPDLERVGEENDVSNDSEDETDGVEQNDESEIDDVDHEDDENAQDDTKDTVDSGNGDDSDTSNDVDNETDDETADTENDIDPDENDVENQEDDTEERDSTDDSNADVDETSETVATSDSTDNDIEAADTEDVDVNGEDKDDDTSKNDDVDENDNAANDTEWAENVDVDGALDNVDGQDAYDNVETAFSDDTDNAAVDDTTSQDTADEDNEDKADLETAPDRDAIEDRDIGDIPSKEDIEATREAIRDFATNEVGNENFGCRENSPDLDWDTVDKDEVLRDVDGKHFWMCVDGQGDDFIRVTPDQASGVLQGPMTTADVTAAMREYLAVGDKPDSTYSFATDFFEDNKYRLDPSTIVDAFASELESFVSGGRDLDSGSINLIADCMVSVQETLVDFFADKVADKIESIIEQTVDTGVDNPFVTSFVDALETVMEPFADRIDEYGFDSTGYENSAAIADTLERLEAAGVSDTNLDRLENVIDTVGRVIDGYPDLMRDVAASIDKDATERDRVDRPEDDVLVAADETDDFDDIELDVTDPIGVEDMTVAERLSYDTEQKEEELEEKEDADRKDDEEDVDYEDFDTLDDGMLDIISDASDDLDSLFRTMMDIDNYDIDVDFDDVDVAAMADDFAEVDVSYENDLDDVDATSSDMTDDTFDQANNDESLFADDSNAPDDVATANDNGLDVDTSMEELTAPDMEFQDDIQINDGDADLPDAASVEEADIEMPEVAGVDLTNDTLLSADDAPQFDAEAPQANQAVDNASALDFIDSNDAVFDNVAQEDSNADAVDAGNNPTDDGIDDTATAPDTSDDAAVDTGIANDSPQDDIDDFASDWLD